MHDFGIQNGRQAAILDLTDEIFCVQVGPIGLHAHTKFGNSSLYGYVQKLCPSDRTDGHTEFTIPRPAFYDAGNNESYAVMGL